jgi:cyclopropane-fatty-acyl-phospholipid synthase
MPSNIAVASSQTSPSSSFQLIVHRKDADRWLAKADPYTLANAFVQGVLEIEGDLVAAAREQLARARHNWRTRVVDAMCRTTPWRLTQRWAGRAATARKIRFHYDRSNEFYRQFLDPNMVYSCAYFRDPDVSLEQAQTAKLDLICRKLRLQAGERFLDVGCGWGALAIRAAQQFGALASGCTLSQRQHEHATARVEREGLAGKVAIEERDYRDVSGQFDKISSVGMFEHVGKPQLEQYFRKIYSLLAPGGLFLNHGITRPAPVHSDAQSMFIARQVFPGGQIVRLEDVIEAAEVAGFEVLDVENLRQHYARTCKLWVENLRAHREECLRWVDERTWRVWQAYLAGSSIAFSDGDLGLHQVLLAKRGAAAPMTRVV